MSEQDKNTFSNMEGFKPLSEEEESKIYGGDSAMPTRCKDDEYLDTATGNCVKKNSDLKPIPV